MLHKCQCGVNLNVLTNDYECPICTKTFTLFKGEYREYELGEIVTNEFVVKLDRLECEGIGLTNKIKRGLIKCREEKSY